MKKTMKRVAPLLALALLAASPWGRPASAGEVLKHEKYQLDNGLTVILHPDDKLPQVVVNIWYHVGTREEPLGRSGFAHLFEHLMFMGTTRVPGSQFDVIMESSGARNNASTGFDRTNYYDWGPSATLPTLLWLEADRMEALGQAMTQEKLDLQRAVVRNERREGYDTAPYGPSELIVWERMFPVDHPYHFHVIGSHEDLVAATVPDVVGFFDAYYVPNNATMVVAGAFEPEQVKPLIQGLFGSIPRGNVPARRSTPVARLDRVERLTVSDEVQLPKLTMVWHSPSFYGPGDAEMDLLAAALAEGENSRLRKRLVREEQVAAEVAAYQLSLRLGSLFYIEVKARPGVSLERIEALVDEELSKLRAEGPSAREIERAVATFETRTLTELQSLREVADTLNRYDAHLGDPDRVDWDLERYRKATPETVRAWGRRTLDLGRRFIMRVVPKTPPVAGAPTREKRPTDFDGAIYVPPEPAVHRMPNGLTIWHVERPDLPLVSCSLVLPGGGVGAAREKAGLAELTATMLTEGTTKRTALEYSDALDVLGAQFAVAASHDDVTMGLTVLRRNFEEAFGLVAEALTSPRFDDQDFARRKALHLAALQQLVDEPTAMAPRVADQAFWGDDPYAVPLAGFPRTVEKLTVADVRRFHAGHHVPAGATLIVAGAVSSGELGALVERHLGAWKGERAPAVAAASPPRAGRPLRVYVVDKPGAAQTVVRFCHPGVGFGDPVRVPLQVLNSLFGGSFTSRLNANLREKHGFTYGAGSAFRTYAERGAFIAASNVKTGDTGAALREFFAEFERIRGGDVEADEAAKARATVRYDRVQAFQELEGVVGAYLPYARYGQPPGRLRADLDGIDEASAEVLNVLAARYVATGRGVLVLVGDRAQIEPQLAPLNLPPPSFTTMEAARAGQLGGK
jgi:predicted Zn-dependent peptidase